MPIPVSLMDTIATLSAELTETSICPCSGVYYQWADAKSTGCTVRLHFSEPDRVAAGERVFSVAVQGRTVIDRLDVVRESGGWNRAVVREFTDVRADGDIRIDLTSIHGRPLLCGVEIVAKDVNRDDQDVLNN